MVVKGCLIWPGPLHLFSQSLFSGEIQPICFERVVASSSLVSSSVPCTNKQLQSTLGALRRRQRRASTATPLPLAQ